MSLPVQICCQVSSCTELGKSEITSTLYLVSTDTLLYGPCYIRFFCYTNSLYQSIIANATEESMRRAVQHLPHSATNGEVRIQL